MGEKEQRTGLFHRSIEISTRIPEPMSEAVLEELDYAANACIVPKTDDGRIYLVRQTRRVIPAKGTVGKIHERLILIALLNPADAAIGEHAWVPGWEVPAPRMIRMADLGNLPPIADVEPDLGQRYDREKRWRHVTEHLWRREA